MVYSQEWTEGMIRGERFGAPKELILLCLVSNRLSKQGDPLLSGLTRDFGVSSIVAEGLKRFHLVKQFPAVRNLNPCLLSPAKVFFRLAVILTHALSAELLSRL